MIVRKSIKVDEVAAKPRAFDDYELRLGDMMRGERATMGKTLTDVQRELRIKATYIEAIEDAAPEVFDTPGFVAGYVRSYARYLNMDPERAFEVFCAESGFSVTHGMSAKATGAKKKAENSKIRIQQANQAKTVDIFAKSSTPYLPTGETVFSRVEPGAIGSIIVLLGLIGAIGFGGYSVLQEVQRVQVAPVEQTPVVLADLDPLNGAELDEVAPSAQNSNTSSPQIVEGPRRDILDRLYRPQALEVPVLVSRDSAIANIDPHSVGNFAAPAVPDPVESLVASVSDATLEAAVSPIPQVVEGPPPAMQMIAAYPSWVRVRAADGTVIYETIMEKGDTWTVPSTTEPATLRTGESGAIYFSIAGECYGPVGRPGTVTSNVPLQQAAISERFNPAPIADGSALAIMVADWSDLNPQAALPCTSS